MQTTDMNSNIITTEMDLPNAAKLGQQHPDMLWAALLLRKLDKFNEKQKEDLKDYIDYILVKAKRKSWKIPDF